MKYRLLAFVLLSTFALTLFAQTKATPAAASEPVTTFRANSRLVVVDVLADDKDGKIISGLKPGDFQVFEAGRPQKIRFFEEHTAPRAITAAKMPPLPPHQYTNFPTEAPRDTINIVLFDLMNTAVQDQAYARKEMLKALLKLPPGRQMAFFVMAGHLQMISSPTADTDKLIRAAQTVLTVPTREMADLRQQNAEGDLTRSMQANAGGATGPLPGPNNENGGQMGGTPDPIDEQLRVALLKEQSFQADNRVEFTLKSLVALARMVSGYPGRKNLIWISSGVPFQIGPNMKADRYHRWREKRDYIPELEQAGTLLANAQITIYPISVGGLSVNNVSSMVSGSGFSATSKDYLGAIRDQEDEQWNSRVAMDDLAAQTGGKVFYGSNDLASSITSAIDHGARYYTLAYSPDDPKWDSTYRNIEVRSARAASLVYRKGYIATRDKPPSSGDAVKVLASAMQPGMPPSTALLTRVQVLPPDKDSPAVRVDYAVAASDVQFLDDGNRVQHSTVDFMAVAWDDKGRVAGTVSNSLETKVKPNTPADALRAGIPGHLELTLKPGKYVMCIGVMDRTTQKIGTVWVPLTVEDAKGK